MRIHTRQSMRSAVLTLLAAATLSSVAAGQDRRAVEAYKQRYRDQIESRQALVPSEIAPEHANRKVVGTLVPGPRSVELKLNHPAARISVPIEFHRRSPGRATGSDRETRAPRIIAEALPEFPLVVEVRTEGGRNIVGDFELQAVDSWKQRRMQLGPTMTADAIDKAMAEVEADFDQLKRQPFSNQAEQSLQKSLSMAEDALITAYQEGIGSEQERELVCEQLGELREARLKARFGREDNYRPEIYDQIYRNSRSICGIVRSGDSQPFGTGVLIGEDLILTCHHNFTLAALEPNQCEVWFNYERVGSGIASPEVFPLGGFVCVGRPIGPLDVPLDFALVRVLPRDDGTAVHSLQEQGEPKYPLPTLDDRLLIRDDAIYVVGHPAGAMRMVHDNAFVLFPFRTNQRGFDTLQMIVCAETQQSPDRGNELKQFLASFLARAPLPGESSSQFEQYSLRWNGMPVFAADCDTSRGNSGSPVFDRQTNGLVGLLHAGEQDLAESHVAGWRRHEAIIPIELILQQIDTQLPGWDTRFKVSRR